MILSHNGQNQFPIMVIVGGGGGGIICNTGISNRYKVMVMIVRVIWLVSLENTLLLISYIM